MTGSKHLEQRSKDVLLALAASSPHITSLGRLQLQKLIYLFDILAIAWRDVSGSETFQPWNHGPYDRAIQNAVDGLAFRGPVAINSLSFSGTRKAQASYSLTSVGKVAVEGLRIESPFADDLALFDEISEEINRRGWSNIKEIVYSEPTYNTARITKQGTTLSVDQKYNLSWKVIKGIRDGFEIARDSPMSKRTLVQVFFATIDEYRVSPDANLATKLP
jgi:hypothetical protein